MRRKIHHQNIRIREAEQKAHQQHSSNESTHHAPNRSGRSRNPYAPRTPRRVRPQLPPRFDRTPDERADSINGNVQHFPHQPETPSDRHDIMSTMEQQHFRQQATMSTAHHTNGRHYGQRRASSNVVDQTVTQTARDYAHTQGHHVPSDPNTRYAPYHRDIYMADPILYTLGTAMYQAKINPLMERHFVHREHLPHYQHSGHNLPTAHQITPSNRSVRS